MAITPRASNMILLSPPHQVENQIENRYRTSEAATPGHLAEMHDDGGELKWRKSASATEYQRPAVYLENGMMNKGIDDAWAADDLARVAFLQPGDIFNALIASGQDISFGEYLQSAGDGTLKTATATTADANLARYQSLDAPGAVTVLTRLRVQVVG